MVKIILFDIDGLLIKLPNYFGEELEKRGYQSAAAILNSFYNSDDRLRCVIGKAKMVEVILPYLIKYGWKGRAEEHFKQQYRFEKKYLDKNLISLVGSLRRQGYRCYLSTDQDENRADFLLNELDFKNIFDGYFISCYIGYRKCHDNFWRYVLEELKKESPEVKSDEIVFFDDKQKNIDVARKFSVRAFLLNDKKQFEKDLVSLNLFESSN